MFDSLVFSEDCRECGLSPESLPYCLSLSVNHLVLVARLLDVIWLS